MNRLVLLLAATTLTFTATAFYYAHALSVEKAQQSRTGLQSAMKQVEPIAATYSTGATAAADKANATGPAEKPDPAFAAVARHHLDQLRDPIGRAQEKKQIAEAYRDAWASTAREIGLSYDELDRFVEALAERALERQQRMFACQLDPTCDSQALAQTQSAGIRQAQADWLGPERYARLLAFNDSSQERREVGEIRRHLTAPNAMSDAQAGRLITALAAERQRIAREAGQDAPRIQTYIGGQAGISVQSGSADSEFDTYAQRMESATRYNQKILELASTVLAAGQMAEFKAMQELKLQEYQEILQEEAIREAARTVAGGKP